MFTSWYHGQRSTQVSIIPQFSYFITFQSKDTQLRILANTPISKNKTKENTSRSRDEKRKNLFCPWSQVSVKNTGRGLNSSRFKYFSLKLLIEKSKNQLEICLQKIVQHNINQAS